MRKGKTYKAKLVGGPFAGCTIGLSDPSGTLSFTAKGMTGRYVNSALHTDSNITLHWVKQ